MADDPSNRQGRPSTVGRIGELTLTFARRGGATVLARARSRSPWHCFPPVTVPPSGYAYMHLINPSGGLVGGDELSIRATLAPETHVLLSTPSAPKVYRSLHRPSCQYVNCRVGAGALLEWVPEPLIPFAGARFRQRLDMTLEHGSTLVLWDAISSGRVARGERWAFTSLENDIRIRTPRGDIRERYLLSSSDTLFFDPDMAAGWDYVGSLFFIGDGIEEGIWDELADRLAEVVETAPDGVSGGVSEAPVPGVIVRLAARAAPPFHDLLFELWKEARRIIWNLPPPSLRRY